MSRLNVCLANSMVYACGKPWCFKKFKSRTWATKHEAQCTEPEPTRESAIPLVEPLQWCASLKMCSFVPLQESFFIQRIYFFTSCSSISTNLWITTLRKRHRKSPMEERSNLVKAYESTRGADGKLMKKATFLKANNIKRHTLDNALAMFATLSVS